MPEPTLDTYLHSLLQIWWGTGRRNGAAAMRVFGNRALTSWAGLLLLPGLAVVALSGLVFGNFWQLHYIAGLSLIPLLLVKLGTTSYRALSYYARRAVYRAAGAPEWTGRLLAPALIVSTIVAMATGIWMWSQHSEAQPWAKLHVLSVVAMGACGWERGIGRRRRARRRARLRVRFRPGRCGCAARCAAMLQLRLGRLLVARSVCEAAGGVQRGRLAPGPNGRLSGIGPLILRLDLSSRLSARYRGPASHERSVPRTGSSSWSCESSQWASQHPGRSTRRRAHVGREEPRPRCRRATTQVGHERLKSAASRWQPSGIHGARVLLPGSRLVRPDDSLRRWAQRRDDHNPDRRGDHRHQGSLISRQRNDAHSAHRRPDARHQHRQ